MSTKRNLISILSRKYLYYCLLLIIYHKTTYPCVIMLIDNTYGSIIYCISCTKPPELREAIFRDDKLDEFKLPELREAT